MNRSHDTNRRARCGLTMLEVVFATMMVGFVLVGAMDLLGAVVSGRTSTTDSARAEQLAHQLMAEVLNGDYQDDTTPVFGLEAGEVAGTRSTFDDVDDYHAYSPLTALGLDGVALANTTGWQREVTIENVNPANPANTSLTDRGVKRITVTVKHDDVVITRLVALRTDKYAPP